jgi:DNA helicase-2/ATP-dependent DNA helicase PcrA
VNELKTRLGDATQLSDVSTIHNFLYRHVVRPYLYLLTDADGTPLVNFAAVRGHDEHHVSQGKVRDWIKGNGDSKIFGLGDQFETLLERLAELTWSRQDDGTWTLAPRSNRGMGPFLWKFCSSEKLTAYKRLYWCEGTIDHDDVLYFAHRILEENPMLREFLAAKLRYLFIDEFQDTMPVQARIVEWLADHGTVVGVIGDPEQAIYGFLKTTPEHFRSFSLPGFVDYYIPDNRRSTAQIIRLLNRIRADDLTQTALRGEEGEPPAVYIGELEQVIPVVRGASPGLSKLWILARGNKDVFMLRRLGTAAAAAGHPWDKFHDADRERALFFELVARAVALAKADDFSKAVDGLVRGIARKDGFRPPLKFDGPATDVARRGVSLGLLEHVLSNHDALASGTLLNAYDNIAAYLLTSLPGLVTKGVKAGAFKTFAASTTFGLLLSTVDLTGEESRDIRSIHQAKGAEADTVCVYLPNSEQVSHLQDATSGVDDEKRRITYVALSRAKNKLILCIPAAHADEDALRSFGFTVQVVP